VDKGHGRVEKRTLRATPILTTRQKWRGVRQGIEITRERTIAGTTTVETVLAITSLSGERANAQALLTATRDHWAIENELHYVRDVTLGEDACRVRAGHAPQVLAALRNAIVHLLAAVPARSRPEAIERLQINPAEALALIGIPQIE
jgi:predicted transposase YbfD/YdcC